MRIAILGAGGVGGVLGAGLARAGHHVHVLARGAHLEAMRSAGLRVETPDEDFTIRIEACEDLDDDPFDLAVVAVKSWSLEEVGQAAARLGRNGAIVLPLLNGVDAADRLASAGVPRDRLLGGLVYISATRVGPGHVRRTSPFQRAVVGELSGSALDRPGAIAAVLSSAGWDAVAVPDFEVHLWRKYIFISAFASACALSRTSIGPIRGAFLGPELLDLAVSEVLAVARAQGVALPPDEHQRIRAQLDGMPAAMKPSLLNDLERGGPTEVDALSGGVSRIGRMTSVPTPIHDAATAAMHAAGAWHMSGITTDTIHMQKSTTGH
jgi:2-dehydropantoate 2-reductase